MDNLKSDELEKNQKGMKGSNGNPTSIDAGRRRSEGVSDESDTESASDFKQHVRFRDKLSYLLRSYRFHVVIVFLVVVDCLLVVVGLLAEMRVLETEIVGKNHLDSKSDFVHIIHKISLGILSLFMLEIFAKLYAFGVVEFFASKFEVFDSVIVITSFVLDICFYDPNSVSSIGSGLIITLRLWRVARIINGIVLTVKRQAERKLRKERRMRDNLLNDLLTQRDYCNALEQENKYLRELLKKHQIEAPPPMNASLQN